MKAIIYSIKSPNINKLYIGSTTQSLKKRWGQHNCVNNKTKAKEILDAGDAFIELVKKVEVENLEELYEIEGCYIRKSKSCNIQIAGRSKKQWTIDNKELVKEKKHQWYLKNKEKVLEKSKKRYSKNKQNIKLQIKEYRKGTKICEICGSKYTNGRKKRHQRSKKCLSYI